MTSSQLKVVYLVSVNALFSCDDETAITNFRFLLDAFLSTATWNEIEFSYVKMEIITSCKLIFAESADKKM